MAELAASEILELVPCRGVDRAVDEIDLRMAHDGVRQAIDQLLASSPQLLRQPIFILLALKERPGDLDDAVAVITARPVFALGGETLAKAVQRVMVHRGASCVCVAAPAEWSHDDEPRVDGFWLSTVAKSKTAEQFLPLATTDPPSIVKPSELPSRLRKLGVGNLHIIREQAEERGDVAITLH